MPNLTVPNDDWETVLRYHPPGPMGQLDYEISGIELLMERRKEYTRAQQDLAEAQKVVGAAGDRDGARYLKALIKDFLRLQRASQKWIDWFEADAGSDLRFNGWPLELAPELDEEINAYWLHVSSLPAKGSRK
jgi:hypothetical protein